MLTRAFFEFPQCLRVSVQVSIHPALAMPKKLRAGGGVDVNELCFADVGPPSLRARLRGFWAGCGLTALGERYCCVEAGGGHKVTKTRRGTKRINTVRFA